MRLKLAKILEVRSQYRIRLLFSRTLIASRPGLSWSTEVTEDIATIVTNFTTELMNSGMVESVLSQLNAIDWTNELAGLQRAAALGKQLLSLVILLSVRYLMVQIPVVNKVPVQWRTYRKFTKF
jgi:hypothetical protein